MGVYADAIAEGLHLMGVHCGPSVPELLERHLILVLAANEDFNLTAISHADAVALHVLDSCSATAVLSEAPAGPFVDLGSGAGYPGIPLHMTSGRPAALVESTHKKARFLSQVVRDLCLRITVHGIRAEELATTHSCQFAAATARSLSSLPSLVELAAPLLGPGGLLICMKGRVSADEIERGRRAAAICGMAHTDVLTAFVPGVEAARTLVTYRKVGSATVDLPRRPGCAQRRPLA